MSKVTKPILKSFLIRFRFPDPTTGANAWTQGIKIKATSSEKAMNVLRNSNTAWFSDDADRVSIQQN